MTSPRPAPRRPLVWRAAANQIAHAHELSRTTTRTLCGLPICQPRLAWPAVIRCPDCRAASGEKAVPMGL